MAEAARRAVPKLKRFIFSGSVEEYVYNLNSHQKKLLNYMQLVLMLLQKLLLKNISNIFMMHMVFLLLCSEMQILMDENIIINL